MPSLISRTVPLVACALALALDPRAAVAAAPLAPAAKAADADPPLANDEEKTLYTIGVLTARNLARFQLTPAELALVLRGLRDEAQHTTAPIDVSVYSLKVTQLGYKRAAAAADAEKERGNVYRERVAKEAGAQSFPSGLVFRTLRAGSGARPTAQDKVKVHYRGTLIDGSEFDSSYKRNEPATFPLMGVIPCWTEALQKMKVGGRALLVCPSSIAYGDGGRPPRLPGGATLVFEVELLEVLPSAPTPSAPPPAKPTP